MPVTSEDVKKKEGEKDEKKDEKKPEEKEVEMVSCKRMLWEYLAGFGFLEFCQMASL